MRWWRPLDAAVPLGLRLAVPVVLSSIVTAAVLFSSLTGAFDALPGSHCAAL